MLKTYDFFNTFSTRYIFQQICGKYRKKCKKLLKTLLKTNFQHFQQGNKQQQNKYII